MFELHTVDGDSMQIWDISGNEIRATPQSQALSIRWPNGGFVWNRPVAIQVEQDGKIERIPIVDVTRLVQVVLWGLSAMFVLSSAILAFRNMRKEGMK
jgi:hypothetical protein